MRRARQTWWSILPALLAAAGGAALIFHQWSGGRPFWVDEEMIALNIRDRSFMSLAGPLWLGQSAPLGWLVLQRAIVMLAGTTEQALRFLPALFGALTLGGAVWIGRRWMTAAGALLLALLCALGLWISFFPLEMKHYSADAFWALVLPALAVWAVETDAAATARRRALAWWAAAALAHWLSNGGLFVTPGCALVLFALLWRRFGAREAAVFALAGLLWLASFAIYYQLSLSHTHHSAYLRGYWRTELPPDSIGIPGTLAWIVKRLPALADDPGGTTMWIALWVSAAAGFVLAPNRALGMACASAPLTAFVLAAAGIVPLWGRFSLWIVPALYAGIAMLADRAVITARGGGRQAVARVALPLLIAAAIVPLAFDIVSRGAGHLREARGPETNHGLQDRDAIEWLLSQRRPGDAIISTRLGWPALWWYGRMTPHDADAARYRVDYGGPGPACRDELRAAMARHTRALVHIGFPDMPKEYEGFGRLLLEQLDRIGVIETYREFAEVGFVAIVALHTPGAEQSSQSLIPRHEREPAPLTGCITVAPAALW